MNNNLRIIFMGTPDFAVPSLRLLLENNLNIVGIVTTPDKPAGRGRKQEPSAIAKFSRTLGLNILQPDNLKSDDFIGQLRALKPDLQVVVAFRMLPEEVWRMPEKGTINLHASLLPDYRGAAPVNWAIINGEKETGLTTFFIDQQIDTGKIIHQEKMIIRDEETAGQLRDRMMNQGAELLLRTVRSIESNDYHPADQQEMICPGSILRTAPKITKEICRINWFDKTVNIHNLIRGLSPYPAAWTEGRKADGTSLTLKIFTSSPEIITHNKTPGTVITDHKGMLTIASADGYLHIMDLQQAGRRQMKVAEFLRGNRDIENCKF